MPHPANPQDVTAPATGRPSTPGDYGFTPGARLGRHVVLERLGGGGMGVVYAAYDPKLDRRIALKLLRPDAVGSAEPQQQLLREAQTLARLAHPNVVNVYDVGEFEGRVYVEMEFVVGRTLAEWLAAEPRHWRAKLRVFIQAGRGLGAAHAIGIVHRDFKPDNVLVGEDGRVRVADFGIALLAAESPAERAGATSDLAAEPIPPEAQDDSRSVPPVVRSLAGGAVRVGTPAYMAPEQRSAGKTDARSDQYSFCLSLYEALHGSRPASRGVASRARSRAIPAWLDQAVARGLSSSPEARHPSMAALLAELESEPRRRRHRWVATAAVSAAALVAGSGWAGIRSHRQGQALVCSGAESAMASVWNPNRRRAIEEAFARTGLRYAAQAATQATAALDRYSRDWVAMHTGACEATRVRGEQSDALMDKRMQCLDMRLAETRTVAEIFEKGDPRVVEHAVQASQGLSRISDCIEAHVRGTPGVGAEPAGKADPAIAQGGRTRDSARRRGEVRGRHQDGRAGARCRPHREAGVARGAGDRAHGARGKSAGRRTAGRAPPLRRPRCRAALGGRRGRRECRERTWVRRRLPPEPGGRGGQVVPPVERSDRTAWRR